MSASSNKIFSSTSLFVLYKLLNISHLAEVISRLFYLFIFNIFFLLDCVFECQLLVFRFCYCHGCSLFVSYILPEYERHGRKRKKKLNTLNTIDKYNWYNLYSNLFALQIYALNNIAHNQSVSQPVSHAAFHPFIYSCISVSLSPSSCCLISFHLIRSIYTENVDCDRFTDALTPFNLFKWKFIHTIHTHTHIEFLRWCIVQKSQYLFIPHQFSNAMFTFTYCSHQSFLGIYSLGNSICNRAWHIAIAV